MSRPPSIRIFKIILSEKKNSNTILLDSEYSGIGLYDVIMDSLGNDEFSSKVRVRYTLIDQIKKSSTSLELINVQQLKLNGPQFRLFNPIIDLKIPNNFREIEIVAEGLEEDQKIELQFSRYALSIDFYALFDHFNNHFSARHNQRIIFSGRFGHGKTTFLDEYFSTKLNDVVVFKLNPVNYSISPNEDIFKYIKCELLFQLMSQGVEFEKLDFGPEYAFEPFLRANYLGVVGTFVKLVPVIGQSIGAILKEMESHFKTFTDLNKEQQTDEFSDAFNFLKSEIDREGGLYEDNFFTQLIRQLFSQIRQKQRKEIVLVIDDLDRLDPEHIFRILNVFSAHYDIPYYNSPNSPNKFEIDKTILVCDLDNIRSVFAHKYGTNADFEGYISKFYSQEPYYFHTKDYLNKYLMHFLPKHQTQIAASLKKVLMDFTNAGFFRIRQVKHLERLDWEFFIQGPYSNAGAKYGQLRNEHVAYFLLIHILLKLYNSSDLKHYFEVLSKRMADRYDKSNDALHNATHYGPIAFNDAIRMNLDHTVEKLSFKFNELTCYGIRTEEMRLPNKGWPFVYLKDPSTNSSCTTSWLIKHEHFYQILFHSLESYIKVGGLEGQAY